jgi:hypothetical protein
MRAGIVAWSSDSFCARVQGFHVARLDNIGHHT